MIIKINSHGWNGFALVLLILFTLIPPAMASEGGIFQMVGNVTISEDQVIDGDVNAMAGNITIYGRVNGNVSAMAGNITVHGRVNGNVNTAAGNVYLRRTAEVDGDAISMAGKVFVDPGANLKGTITELGGTGSRGFRSEYRFNFNDFNLPIHFPIYFWIWGAFTGIISWLAFAALLMFFFSSHIARMGASIEERPAYYFLMGLLAFALFPPVLVLTIITIVGIPVAFFLIFLVIFGTLFGQLGVARSLGIKVIQSLKLTWDSEMSKVLTGVITIFIITLIPVLGWVFFLITACMGLGSAIINRFGVKPKGDTVENA